MEQQKLSVLDYQQRATKTFKPHLSERDEICDWMVSLAEETGEIGSLIKHHFWGGEELNKEELAKEVGDVLWYLAAMCTSLGINMETAAELNVCKLEHRFGGGSFSLEGSQARHDKEKQFAETELYKQLISRLSLAR